MNDYKLLWVVQNNLYNEDGYVRFLNSLERLNCNYIVIKPIPFTNIIVPEDFDSMVDDVSEAIDPISDDTQPIMICGATSLNRIAKARGWSPGSFLNDNFHYEKWRENWGDDLLNPDCWVGKIKDFVGLKPFDALFVRPTEDTKSISGTVMEANEFIDWILTISDIEDDGALSPLHKNTEIVISSIKEIYNECRLFIVDGKVVTASMYKVGNRVMGDLNVDQRYFDFTQKMVDKWSPSLGFVMDIADTPNGLKIIEINNLNSAGFYACDTFKIIDSIERLYE